MDNEEAKRLHERIKEYKRKFQQPKKYYAFTVDEFDEVWFVQEFTGDFLALTQSEQEMVKLEPEQAGRLQGMGLQIEEVDE